MKDLQVVTENENYICYADPERKDKDGVAQGYVIVNRLFAVEEVAVNDLSQAYIYMYQMNDLLVESKWRELIGLEPLKEQSTATIHEFPAPDKIQ